MAVAAARSLGRLLPTTCYFFVCDMQEKFRPTIRYYPEIINVAQRMVINTRENDERVHLCSIIHVRDVLVG